MHTAAPLVVVGGMARQNATDTSTTVQILDVPTVFERTTERSMLVAWAGKLLLIGAAIWLFGGLVLRTVVALGLSLLGTMAALILPIVLLWFVLRVAVAGFGSLGRTSAGFRVGGRFGWMMRSLVGLRLLSFLFGPPRRRGTRTEVVTAFAGERRGRRRMYELVTSRDPALSHGDLVRVWSTGRLGPGTGAAVLALRGPNGLVMRSGVLSRVCVLVAIIGLAAWWSMR